VRTTALWILAAIAGVLLVAGVTAAASSLSTQAIGLSSEPLTAGEQLTPRATPTATPKPQQPARKKKRKRPTATPTPTPTAVPTAVPTVDDHGGGSDDNSGKGSSGSDDHGSGGHGADD
jgi:hypothetical protein